MTVKIVTDSGADLSEEIIKELGIIVVPLHILFGEDDYKDGEDISIEEFYQRLINGPIHPTTSTASPGEFSQAYKRAIEEGANGIVSICISQKLSKVYESALQGKKLIETEKGNKCQIEVIDSEAGAMAMGFLVILAAKLADEGKKMQKIVKAVKESIPHIHLFGAFDTVKYLIRGGRAPRVAIIADILKIKTFIKLKDGEIHPAGRTRKQQEKIDKLVESVKVSYEASKSEVKAIAVEYSTNKEEAENVREQIKMIYPNTPIYFTRLGSVLGVHAGPGTMVVSLITEAES